MNTIELIAYVLIGFFGMGGFVVLVFLFSGGIFLIARFPFRLVKRVWGRA